jgi:succinoglycan biosynthesis transport protein ExoP
MGQANEAAVGLRALEREAQANRLLLEKFLTTFTEASAQEDVKSQLPDARIISRAPVPDDPSFPRKALLIAVAFAGSAVLGVLLAFAAEHLDAGFHSSEEVETEIKLPVIATVPLVKIAGSGKAELAAYATRNPASAFADSIRGIYTHLLLSFKGQPPKTVLFTSSEAGEGKTTVALSFARQQAQAGRRVILVDADFRRSRIGRRAGVALAPGLSELIAGTASIAEATQGDPESPAVLLVAGKQPLMNFAIDDVSRLGALLTELRSEYDVIVIDSPPVLALADARMLSAMADVSLVVVRWGRTPRRVLRFAIRQMTASGGDVHGVVMSMVNIKRQAAYGFGDASYYRGDLTKYYTG